MKFEINPLPGHGVTVPSGYLAAGVSCGLKASGRPDLAIIYSEAKTTIATGVFTINKFAAAPINVSKELLSKTACKKAIVINSGNANAGTGTQGMENCWSTVQIAALALNIEEDDLLIASTGIIGKQLDMTKLSEGVHHAAKNLSYYGGPAAAEAIMTTDTFQKEFMVEVEINGSSYKIGGMAKGSGMIAPDMATLLGVITTDAQIEPELLLKILKESTDDTFNMVSVDGCQSTNDCVFVLANGMSGVKIDNDDLIASFTSALHRVCYELAKMIASDGEGATKLVEVKVKGAKSKGDAREVAKAIVSNDLVKSACFGNDPNWGRVIAAAGSCKAEIDPGKIELFLQDQKLVENSLPLPFNEEKASKSMDSENIKWLLKIGDGKASASALGCDLSYDYVKINAEYTT